MDLETENDSMLSLLMLAEVASVTLKNDTKLKSDSCDGTPKDNVMKVALPKKSFSSSDRLTLDEIKRLSDKMLVEMFSELTSDEMRKNYSFKCLLMPEKCAQVFTSFGNESKAKLKIKTHLLSHLKELAVEANNLDNDPCFKFTAEPLHVRKKKLKCMYLQWQDATARKGAAAKQKPSSKSFRKKKRKKQIMKKQKFNFQRGTMELENSDEKKSLKSTKLDLSNSKGASIFSNVNYDSPRKIPNGVHKRTSITEKKHSKHKYGHSKKLLTAKHLQPNCSTDFSENICDDVHLSTDYKQTNYFNSGFLECIQQYSDSDDSVSSILAMAHNISPQLAAWQHDHTYTSVEGNRFANKSTFESNKSTDKIHRDNKYKSRRRETRLIIPTPPFPDIYVPILPNVSDMYEIDQNCETIYRELTTPGIDISLENYEVYQHFGAIRKERNCSGAAVTKEEPGPNSEDDENLLFDSMDDGVEDIDAGDCNFPEVSPCNDLLKTDCPESLKALEKKLAVKYIRQLRSKKKDERGPLVCQICQNKGFTAQATLMYHYRSHAGIKPFTCRVCKATFTRQHSLNYHMLIHNNETRFVCEDCGRNFRHPSHYKEHLRCHTGETPYGCTDCNLRFKTRNTYKRHLKTRHGKILTAQGIRVLT